MYYQCRREESHTWKYLHNEQKFSFSLEYLPTNTQTYGLSTVE